MPSLDQLKQTFFDECDEALQQIEAGLTDIRDGAHSDETINAVFRAVHSVKGGAGIFGFEALVGFAHVFETLLDGVRHGTITAASETIDALLSAGDVLSDLVSMSRSGEAIAPGFGNDVRNTLQRIIDGKSGSAAPAAAAEDDNSPAPADFEGIDFKPVQIDFEEIHSEAPAGGPHRYTITFRPKPDLLKKANEPLYLIRELRKLGELELTAQTAALPPLTEMEPDRPYIWWTGTLETGAPRAKIDEVFEFVVGDCELEIVDTSAPAVAVSTPEVADAPPIAPNEPAAPPPAPTAPMAEGQQAKPTPSAVDHPDGGGGRSASAKPAATTMGANATVEQPAESADGQRSLTAAAGGDFGLKAIDPESNWETTLAPLAFSTQIIPARRTICHPKEWSDAIPVICQGWAASSITLLDGRRQILAFLLPGDLVSTAYLLEPMSGRTVEAVTDVTCRKFSRSELKAFLFKQPALLDKLSKAWAEERAQADQLALDLGRRTADERIARLILHLVDRLAGSGTVNRQTLEFPLRQRHIADATGLTPVHVSKVLSELQRARLLDINRRTLTILNEIELRRVADWR